jgi:hypothetical protein
MCNIDMCNIVILLFLVIESLFCFPAIKYLQPEFEGTVFVLEASQVESGRVFPRRVESSSDLTSQVAESRQTEPSRGKPSRVDPIKVYFPKFKKLL